MAAALALLFVSVFVTPHAADAYPLSSMGLEFVTTSPNEVAQIGFSGTLTNVTIDWGDGSSLENISGGVNIPEWAYSHTYSTPGTYVAVLSATTLSHFGYCGNPTNNWNLKRILSWGSMNTTDLTCGAWSRTALTSVPATLPASVTNLNYMFYDAHVFNQDLSDWDTSNVVSMERTFQSAPSFNQSLATWNMSSVVDALGMLTNTTDLSDANYSRTLVGWASQPLQPNINLDAVPAQAVDCPAIAARNTLLNAPNTWRIADEAPTQVCADAVTAPNTLAETGASMRWGIVLAAALFFGGVIAIGLVIVFRRRAATQSERDPAE